MQNLLHKHGLGELPANQKHHPHPVSKIYDSCNQATAGTSPTRFFAAAEKLDIRHVYIRPRTPRLDGNVERSHRVDNEESYQLLNKGGVSDDAHLFNQKLREWENYYNHNRLTRRSAVRRRSSASSNGRIGRCHASLW